MFIWEDGGANLLAISGKGKRRAEGSRHDDDDNSAAAYW